MTSTMPVWMLVAIGILVASYLIVSGLSFGAVQTLLPLAFLGSAAMFFGFLAVAWSKDGH